jgi:hypothetical protein
MRSRPCDTVWTQSVRSALGCEKFALGFEWSSYSGLSMVCLWRVSCGYQLLWLCRYCRYLRRLRQFISSRRREGMTTASRLAINSRRATASRSIPRRLGRRTWRTATDALGILTPSPVITGTMATGTISGSPAFSTAATTAAHLVRAGRGHPSDRSGIAADQPINQGPLDRSDRLDKFERQCALGRVLPVPTARTKIRAGGPVPIAATVFDKPWGRNYRHVSLWLDCGSVTYEVI